MKIKVYVIFCVLFCANVCVNAMHTNTPYSSKSIPEILWNKHQNERVRYYQKLGIPMPDELANETYQEAMVQHLRNKAHNEAAAAREITMQQETQKK